MNNCMSSATIDFRCRRRFMRNRNFHFSRVSSVVCCALIDILSFHLLLENLHLFNVFASGLCLSCLTQHTHTHTHVFVHHYKPQSHHNKQFAVPFSLLSILFAPMCDDRDNSKVIFKRHKRRRSESELSKVLEYSNRSKKCLKRKSDWPMTCCCCAKQNNDENW